MDMQGAGPVVMVKATIMDGTVVRWYRSVSNAENHRAVLSASRNGVLVESGEYLTKIPQDWIDAARQAYDALASNRDADLSHLATHRNGHGLANGPIEAIQSGGEPR